MFMIFSNLSMYIGSFAKLEQAKMCRTAKHLENKQASENAEDLQSHQFVISSI